MKKKAVALLSGGLDSTLALKLILDQGIDVVALNLTSVFCTCNSRQKKGICSESIRVAKEFNIPIKVVSKGLDYLEIIKKPKYGYGRALNPCIDCRIYSFKKAKKLMKSIRASFIITGEVLGQRPMSQRLKAMKIIEKESGLESLVLRPLSAKYLKPTLPELQGIVNRDQLIDIKGRSRKKQIELASKLNIHDYPCAAGGCRLTEKEYTKKLKDYLENEDQYSFTGLQLLRYGRHFRICKNHKIIVGRNETDNIKIKNLSSGKSVLIEPDFPGPSALITGIQPQEYAERAMKLIKKYTKNEKFKNSFILITNSKKITANLPE